MNITEGLLELDALVRIDGETDARRRDSDPLAAGAGENCPYELGPEAINVFAGIGVDLETIHNGRSRRPLLRACVDWTEQRHHIAGTLGAEICRAWIEAGWIVRRQRERAITLTTRGERALEVRLGRTL